MLEDSVKSYSEKGERESARDAHRRFKESVSADEYRAARDAAKERTMESINR